MKVIRLEGKDQRRGQGTIKSTTETVVRILTGVKVTVGL